ncbi:hypothetical protein BJ322DRAFT_1112471 [Thelephora terrestris]|uniref:DUF6535 domain-containing protein n=1 Tax=Thelephora terrestris TaxID=56493 RepID=A0A9P6L319_9AGAM|nr:hypothetical protein BJ322DRAFT_1112471 [Thelephora terrestris]
MSLSEHNRYPPHMNGPGEIVVDPRALRPPHSSHRPIPVRPSSRTRVGDDSGQEDGPDLIRQGTAGALVDNMAHRRASHCPRILERDEANMRMRDKTANSKRTSALPVQKDCQALFYDKYHEMAKGYDEDFVKKYGGDLDTTLIFAGLFSAVASAFIIDVDSQLQPNTGAETAALLRVLIYKIDNTTFGNDVPAVPQWNGPPRAMVHVQAILFASLSASLLAALLAMLGKQWLNRYDSSDMRRSAVERDQNRQRKLDGITAWYFDYVMESLPVMLQAALLLLGCALSRYLWEVSTIVASVVVGVTSFGVLFYLFIVIAGVASESCPYQTPASLVLRYLKGPFEKSGAMAVINVAKYYRFPPWFGFNILCLLVIFIIVVPLAFAFDVLLFTGAMVRKLGARAHHLAEVRRAYHYLGEAHDTPEQRHDQQTTVSDLRCISWTLQTSLDKDIRLLAVEHLETKTELPHFNPTLVVSSCFDVLTGCLSMSGQEVAFVQGKEQLGIASARCFLRSFHHLLVTNEASSALADLRQRYNRVFSLDPNSMGLLLHHATTKIHALVSQDPNPPKVRWDNYRPPRQEHIAFTRHMVEAAKLGYQQRHRKVPRWILRFALHSLSLDPPDSVVADCLTIAAIDLGCQVSNISAPKESARVEQLSNLITRTLKSMIEAANPDSTFSKRKTISTILFYALSRRGRQQGMFDATLRAVEASPSQRFMWYQAGRYIATMVEEPIPSFWSLDELIRWARAVLVIPYTEEIGRSVVGATLQIASEESLRPYIPIGVWAWLKERPSLPPVCRGRSLGTDPDIIRHVRRLGDLEILKSYFLLVWSEWELPSRDSLDMMKITIREDFSGTRMRRHREDLVQRLDHVLGELRREPGHFNRHIEGRLYLHIEDWIKETRGVYRELRDVLLEVEGKRR